jgi:hypothetical protein
MLDIGSTEFILKVPSLPENELKRLSTSLFKEWEDYVDTALSLPDYSMFLQVEEGSVKGAAKIGVAVGALYLAIGNYGDFISGVKTISEQVSATGSFLAENAKTVFNCPDSSASSRKKGGALSSIQRLFVRVQKGEITADEAMVSAEKILGAEASGEKGFISALSDALRTCPHFHEQMMLSYIGTQVIESPDEMTLLQSDRKPIPRDSQPKPELGPTLQFRVEVWRDSKKKRRQTRVVKL